MADESEGIMTRDEIIRITTQILGQVRISSPHLVGDQVVLMCTIDDVGRLIDGVAALEREECAALHGHPDVLAPVGNSAWGEAHQEGWINGTAAYRDAIRAKHWQGSSIATSGELTEAQNRAIVAIIQGQPVAYEGESTID